MKPGCADVEQVKGWLAALGYTVSGDDVEPGNRASDPSSLVAWSLHVVDEDWGVDSEGLSDDEFEDLLETDRSNHQVVAIGPESLADYEPKNPVDLEDIDPESLNHPDQTYLRTRDDVVLWHRWAERQRQLYWQGQPGVLMTREPGVPMTWPGTDLWSCPACSFRLAIPQNSASQEVAQRMIQSHAYSSCKQPS